MNCGRFNTLHLETRPVARYARVAAALAVATALWCAGLDPALALAGTAASVIAGWPGRRTRHTTITIVYDREAGTAVCRRGTGAARAVAADLGGTGWAVLRVGGAGGRADRLVVHRALLGRTMRRELRLWALAMSGGR